jgi:hypothetical protein
MQHLLLGTAREIAHESPRHPGILQLKRVRNEPPGNVHGEGAGDSKDQQDAPGSHQGARNQRIQLQTVYRKDPRPPIQKRMQAESQHKEEHSVEEHLSAPSAGTGAGKIKRPIQVVRHGLAHEPKQSPQLSAEGT